MSNSHKYIKPDNLAKEIVVRKTIEYRKVTTVGRLLELTGFKSWKEAQETISTSDRELKEEDLCFYMDRYCSESEIDEFFDHDIESVDFDVET